MARAIVDGRINGDDGIGRYTRCLLSALASVDGLSLAVVRPDGASHYEGLREWNAFPAGRSGDVIHLLDYRAPLRPCPVPLIATIHDVLRAEHPNFCYSDKQFVSKFTGPVFDELVANTRILRNLCDPPRTEGPWRSWHAEFYSRMLAYTASAADCILVPTRASAAALLRSTGRIHGVHVLPYGIDHPSTDSAALEKPPLPSPYFLHVGQARPHKGLDRLVRAYRASAAWRTGIPIAFVGADFARDGTGARFVSEHLGPCAAPLGAVNDRLLRALYAGARALIHLSRYEGFGFTPLEALSVGTEAIVSDIPVFREVLGPVATYVDPDRTSDVVTAVDEALRGDGGGPAGCERRRWSARYTWRGHAEAVARVYGESRSCARPS